MTTSPRIPGLRIAIAALTAAALIGPVVSAQSQRQSPTSGRRYPRLVIRNATIVDGNGTPASGPKDIVVEGTTITEVVPLDPVALKRGDAKRPAGDVEIDATGKYVLPGLINNHGHVQDERGGLAQPLDYELKLWLGCGITSVRDVGSDPKKTIALRERSNKGEVASPRIFVYARFNANPAPPQPRPGSGARAGAKADGGRWHQAVRHRPRHHGGDAG